MPELPASTSDACSDRPSLPRDSKRGRHELVPWWLLLDVSSLLHIREGSGNIIECGFELKIRLKRSRNPRGLNLELRADLK